jgi:hypothetical protein
VRSSEVGPVGGNAWARGEIVKGKACGFPFRLTCKSNGQSIIADRID